MLLHCTLCPVRAEREHALGSVQYKHVFVNRKKCANPYRVSPICRRPLLSVVNRSVPVCAAGPSSTVRVGFPVNDSHFLPRENRVGAHVDKFLMKISWKPVTVNWWFHYGRVQLYWLCFIIWIITQNVYDRVSKTTN